MRNILVILAASLFLTNNLIGQKIDSLKLFITQIPENYTITKKNNCISIQACTFYDSPDMYEMLIGKIKNKEIQNFESKKDSGSIMYFEFETEFQGSGFLEGLLWGEAMKPTKEHPEQYFTKGNILIIWSFNNGSKVKLISEEKIKGILK